VYSIVIAIILSLLGIRISNNPQATGKKPRRLNDAGKKK
jgi:hypothetical protein